jgi:hypothetical protein
VSAWCNKCKDGRTALNDDSERHGGRTKHTDRNRVIVEGLISEGRKVKFRETQCKKADVQYLTSLGEEHYSKEMLKLVKAMG